jgi:hypothetical protein
VRDTGQGIAVELLPHVFERFLQGDSSSTRQHGGLGIGLALVRHLVELHGGSVSADSHGVGTGATFVVRLPISLAADARTGAARVHPTASGPAVAAPEESLAGVRVLLVDDEIDTLELFARVLASTGAAVDTAPSTAAAMRCFEQRPPDGARGRRRDAWRGRLRADPPRARAGRRPRRRRPGRCRHRLRAVEDRVRLLAAGFSMHVPKPGRARRARRRRRRARPPSRLARRRRDGGRGLRRPGAAGSGARSPSPGPFAVAPW